MTPPPSDPETGSRPGADPEATDKKRLQIAEQANETILHKQREERADRVAARRAAKAAARAAKGRKGSAATESWTTGDATVVRRAPPTNGQKTKGKNKHAEPLVPERDDTPEENRKSVEELALVQPKGPIDPDPQVWGKTLGVQDTSQLAVPKLLIDQVLGQEEAVALARKAAEQKRHLLLIGDPGTGKSMLAKALAAILPDAEQNDVLVYHNSAAPNNPKSTAVDGGAGAHLVYKYERKARKALVAWKLMEWSVALGAIATGLWLVWKEGAQIMTLLFIVLLAMVFLWISSSKRPKSEIIVPKLLIRKPGLKGPAPYIDATGSQAGALLGDVRHDPYQAGGLETPPHQRVEIGGIHRAHRGVLFIDEINTLKLASQQNLLTALQERKYAISGQSASSAGAMVKTEPIPCDFILVAAGNLDAVMKPEESLSGETGMHPALRSRLRGYGYEVYMNGDMEDNHLNRIKLLQFVAQEVRRDGKIPHFTTSAATEIIREAQRRAAETGKLTLRLRELGGLVRTAGDMATSERARIVSREHVMLAKRSSRSLEQQMAEMRIRRKLSSVHIENRGVDVGSANGGASVGTGEVGEPAGVVVPVEATVVGAPSQKDGAVIVGPHISVGEKHALATVAAVVRRVCGAALAGQEVHVDGYLPHPEADVDGVAIATAVACISAARRIPLRQDIVIVGMLGLKGHLRTAPHTLQIIEAAARHHFATAIVPLEAKTTLLIDDWVLEKIQIVYCDSLDEVLAKVTAHQAAPRTAAAKAVRR